MCLPRLRYGKRVAIAWIERAKRGECFRRICPVDKIIFKGALSLLLVQIANFALPLVTFPYLLRVLGPKQFGLLVFSQAIMAYCVLLTDYGFNLTGTKAIAEHRSDKAMCSRIFWEILVTKSCLAVASFLVVTVLVLLIPQFSEMAVLIYACFPLVIGTVMFPQWLFQGMERLGFVSLSVILARLATIPLTFSLVHEQSDAWLAALINSSAPVVSGMIAVAIILRYRLIGRMSVSLPGIMKSLRDGWHVFISSAAISLYTTTNTVVLGLIAGPIQVGYFAAADKIRAAAQSLISPLGNAVYPRVSALMAVDHASAFQLIRRLLLVQGGATFMISVGLFILAPWVVHIAMGSGYERSVDVLRIMAFLPFIIGLSNVFGIQTMLTLGMKRLFSRILIGSGILNLLMLIPLSWSMGSQGAGIAVLITETAVTVVMAVLLFKKKIPVFFFRAQ